MAPMVEKEKVKKSSKVKKMAPPAALGDVVQPEKKMAPPSEGVVQPEKKRVYKKKLKNNNFSIYIHRVSKLVDPNIGVSPKSMSIMNSFINDLFERIAMEAGTLAKYSKGKTISSKTIQCACSLVLQGELAKHAVSEGSKALRQYYERDDETME